MPLSAVSPRVFQLYSPRRPSPLGLPPLAPHSIGSQDIQPCSAYPKTPERYYHQYYNFSEPSSHGMRFPPDVHRRTSTTTQRAARASPPAPLSLDAQYHPAAMVHLPSIEETLQFRVPRAPSPTPSSTSSLSLYSTESAKKSLENGEEGDGEGKKKGGGGGGGGFCFCFNLSALFGTKSKPNKILAPQAQVQEVMAAEPSPAPQMVQTRRRPPSLVLVQ